MIWSVVHFVITPGHFGAFIMPLRPHKTSDQYPLKSVTQVSLTTNLLENDGFSAKRFFKLTSKSYKNH